MKRSFADTAARSTAGTSPSYVPSCSCHIMFLYTHRVHKKHLCHTGYSVFSPKSPFPEWTCMGYLFIAAQGEILDRFRELITQGKVSFMGLCAGQRAGNISSVREWCVIYL